MFRYLLLWFPMLVLAIINGAARDLWYSKFVGELAARQISTVLLVVLFAVYFVIINKYFTPKSATYALLIGFFWLVLTLLFEFGLGRYSGKSWAELFDDYNILKGHLWIVIPIWVAVGPLVMGKLLNVYK